MSLQHWMEWLLVFWRKWNYGLYRNFHLLWEFWSLGTCEERGEWDWLFVTRGNDRPFYEVLRIFQYYDHEDSKIRRKRGWWNEVRKGHSSSVCVCTITTSVLHRTPNSCIKQSKKNRDDRTIPIPTSLVFHIVSYCSRPKWRTSKFTGRLHATLCCLASFSATVDLTIYKKN